MLQPLARLPAPLLLRRAASGRPPRPPSAPRRRFGAGGAASAAAASPAAAAAAAASPRMEGDGGGGFGPEFQAALLAKVRAGEWEGAGGWSPVQQTRFLTHGRDWRGVRDYYARLVAGTASLADIGLAPHDECIAAGAAAASPPPASSAALEAGSEGRSSSGVSGGGEEAEGARPALAARERQARLNFRVALSYLGPSWDGWMDLPGVASVEAAAAAALGPLCAEGKPPKLSCAGRTDKGVSAACQARVPARAGCPLLLPAARLPPNPL